MSDHGRPARRVVITGVGLHTPVGRDTSEVWDALRAAEGTSATRIHRFDPEGLDPPFAAQVPGSAAPAALGAKESRRADRATLLGLAAALDAWADAGGGTGQTTTLGDVSPERLGVVAGTGYGGAETYEAAFATLDEHGWGRPGPMHVPGAMANATAAAVSLHLPVRGPSMCLVTACASGAQAIGEGARLIREGTCEAVIAGGTEATITPTTVRAFNRLDALSTRHRPEAASRPFDTRRDGFVIGEGSAFLVLESRDNAVRRGAVPYGELAGYGRTSDGYHLTAPDPDGAGAQGAMRMALGDAGLTPTEVTHVSAHATSTPRGDAVEAQAIAKVFGSHAVPVTAVKGVTGHLLGAAGAVEAIVALLAMRHREVPPVANLAELDPHCPIDAVRCAPRPMLRGPALSTSFGFGGHNAALVLVPTEAGDD